MLADGQVIVAGQEGVLHFPEGHQSVQNHPEEQGVTPDIVVLGKPIGNGHPLGAVVTTPEIAAAADTIAARFAALGLQPAFGDAWFQDFDLAGMMSRYLHGCGKRLGIDVLCWVVMPDHVHLLVGVPPQLSPSRLMQAVKGKSSHRLLHTWRLNAGLASEAEPLGGHTEIPAHAA